MFYETLAFSYAWELILFYLKITSLTEKQIL